jgi:CRP/FNR family transcriptional regulator, cyclic AMP receptor protein
MDAQAPAYEVAHAPQITHVSERELLEEQMAVADGEVVEYLARHPSFEGLAPNHLRLLASFAGESQVPAGHRLFTRDDDASYFYLVKRGSVSVEVPSIEGDPLKIQTVKDDSLLGWSWIIPPYRWSFDARAETPCVLLAFDGEKLRAACETDAKLGYSLLKCFAMLMAERLNAARVAAMRHYAEL